MQLVACELEIGDPLDRVKTLTRLRHGVRTPLLILNTCQRLECWGLEEPEPGSAAVLQSRRHEEAFTRLARIAAGLESRILGELEILGQVRQAYKEFREAGGMDHARLDRMFQDALSLAREARRESGIDKNLTSLGALASRALMERVPAASPVAVVGAGSLAGSVARYLNKRGDHPIRVSSRCPENAMALATQVGGFAGGLDGLAHLLHDVRGIVTATAAPHPVLYAEHLRTAARPLVVIDLGVPRDCHEDVRSLADVTYINLEAIEEQAQVNSAERLQKAEQAEQIIRDGAHAWASRRR